MFSDSAVGSIKCSLVAKWCIAFNVWDEYSITEDTDKYGT